MNEYKESLGRKIIDVLRDLGIDPFYGLTILMLILAFSYRKDIKNWKELEGWRKVIIISTFYAAITVSIISLLRLTGVIQL